MNKNSEQSKLLDALLADETWRACSGHLQHHALATLSATRKSRARRAVALQMMAILAVFAVVGLLLRSESGSPSRRAHESIARSESPPSRTGPIQHSSATYITEQQMLAMFPQGSCVLAEINGQKQLVVLDDAAISQATHHAEIQ